MRIGLYTAGCLLFAQLGAVHAVTLQTILPEIKELHDLAQNNSENTVADVADALKKESTATEKTKPAVNNHSQAQKQTHDHIVDSNGKAVADTYTAAKVVVDSSKAESGHNPKEAKIIKTGK